MGAAQSAGIVARTCAAHQHYTSPARDADRCLLALPGVREFCVAAGAARDDHGDPPSDLRRWTGLAEKQLPHDLVYVQELFFEAVGDAVREAGGVPNQFIGDSVMAIFGAEGESSEAARTSTSFPSPIAA